MNTQDVLDMLHDYRTVRDQTRELRNEIIETAIELGCQPRDASNGQAAAFLDGWLTNMGHVPRARRMA